MRMILLFNNDGSLHEYKTGDILDESKVYKKCNECGLLPLNKFYKGSKRRLCIACVKRMNVKIYSEHKENYKQKYYKYEKKKKEKIC